MTRCGECGGALVDHRCVDCGTRHGESFRCDNCGGPLNEHVREEFYDDEGRRVVSCYPDRKPTTEASIVQTLALLDPLERGVTMGHGSFADRCRFCGGVEWYGQPQHHDHCVWLRACEAVSCNDV